MIFSCIRYILDWLGIMEFSIFSVHTYQDDVAVPRYGLLDVPGELGGNIRDDWNVDE